MQLAQTLDRLPSHGTDPAIAHMRWDNEHIVRSVVRWVDAVRKGKADRKSIKLPAEFVPGGSIGPGVDGVNWDLKRRGFLDAALPLANGRERLAHAFCSRKHIC